LFVAPAVLLERSDNRPPGFFVHPAADCGVA
jgi:hypothetical protein